MAADIGCFVVVQSCRIMFTLYCSRWAVTTCRPSFHSWETTHGAPGPIAFLKRGGPFWHAEYYDHIVRDATDLRNQVDYAWGNSDAAGCTSGDGAKRDDALIERYLEMATR
jgi:hypothetical protein